MIPHSTPRPRRWRALAMIATLLVPIVAQLIAAPSATHAAGNTLSFENGDQQIAVGANAAVYVDGTITYAPACSSDDGTIDFVYPATDVYVVATGSAAGGAQLTDVGGHGPNTIVATSGGAFIGELIAVTTPSGSLGEGVYDVVFDTCQDKTAGPDDAIFEAAITVDLPDGDLPPADPSIAQLKEAARQQYVSWLQAHIAFTALFNLEEAQALVSCILSVSYSCLAELFAELTGIDSSTGQLLNWLKDRTLELVMNRAKNYGAIWQDPPDGDFERLPVVVPEAVSEPPSVGSTVGDALRTLFEPMADEGALAEALLHSIERYQGAQAAGDEEWALVHARAVRDLSSTLADQLSSSTALQEFRDAIAADVGDIAGRAVEGATAHHRIRTTGFGLEERRAFANLGFDAAAIDRVESSIVKRGQVLAPTAAEILAMADGLVAARTGMVAALQATTAGWDDVATELEARVKTPVPVAVAGGPYTATAGSVQLDAGASTTPAGSSLVSFEWDVDGDGQFDDATGATPVVAVDGDTVVALRVTNDAGRAAVDAAVVSATPPAGPAIDTVSPAPAVVATVGQTTTFEVSATGDSVTYAWAFEGGDVLATAPTFEYTPTIVDVGQRMLHVTVTTAGRSATRSWWVSTLAVDADGDGWTATSDCDDTRADVHPGGFERLGNERDDDCDARTPDIPVGGLTGQVWSWGFYAGLGTGSGVTSSVPAPVTTLGDDVRAVESTFRGGHALLTDGTVRSWGLNHTGDLGDGTNNSSMVPVTVKNVGGGGALGNVVELSNDAGHVVARHADGTVTAWGLNASHELGDGSSVYSRLSPVVVLGEDGNPLGGVAQVDTTNGASYFVMDDGTVKVAGIDRCRAGTPTPVINAVASTNPLFGDQVVQIGSGTNGAAIVLNADGSVHACAGTSSLLGRGGHVSLGEALTPAQVLGFGPGSGVIDVAMGYETALALTEDGTVWTWGTNLNHSLDVLGLAGSASQWAPAPVPLPDGPPVIDVETDNAATMFATRADGSVVVWGGNVYNGAGAGTTDYAVVGTPTIDLDGGQAVSVKNSMWNGLALVRPVTPGADPVLPLHWIDVSVDDTAIGEAAGGDVTIRLSEAAPADVTVEYEFGGVAASALVAAGSTSVAVPLAVTDDIVDEDDEDLVLTITSASHGATIARHTAVVTVVDDDAAPTVTVADAMVTEGDTSLTDVTVELELSSASARDIVVDHTTIDGSATAGTPGDYTSSVGSTLIPAGETTATLHVAVVGDTAMETTETFAVQLTAAEHATVAGDDAVVSIIDDEPLVVTVTSPAVTEGDTGTTDATFDVSVTPPLAGETVTVPWQVAGGTAELATDVIGGSGELVLDADAPNGVVVAQVVGDTLDEDLDVETFRLDVGAAASSYGRPVVLADLPAATIVDDDAVAAVRVDAGPDATGVEGSPVAITGTVEGVDATSAAVTTTWSVDDAQCVLADPAALATTVTCADEAAATLTLTVDDGSGTPTSDTTSLDVANVAPTVTISAPVDGSTIDAGAPVGVAAVLADPGTLDTVSCSVDWGDGTASTACDTSHAFGSAGSFTIVVTADDGDGGTATASVGVVVAEPGSDPAWLFDGFHQPVDNAPVVNVVQAGSTVPLKFGLGGDHGLDIFAGGFPASVQRPCDGQAGDVLEETGTPGATALVYDAATDRYHYNWQTKKAWSGTCRRLVLRFVDGTEVTAEFRFR